MIFEGFEFAISYGLAGILVLAIGIILVLHYRLEKKVSNNGHDITDLKEGAQGMEDTFIARKKDMKKIFDKIEVLEKEDVKFEGSFKTVDTKLNGLAENVGDIKRDVKTIVDHFAQKGMNNV